MPVITKVFSISGMHCASCATKISSAVKNVPGVKAAFVDLRGNRMTVDAEPSLPVDKLLAAVSSAGYSAKEN